jgi:hypothetical protein
MRGIKHPEINTPAAAFRVCQTLQPHLSTLIGKAGFQSLLARALSLAKPDSRWLHAVHVAPDGVLSLLGELPAPSARQIAEGGVDLVAALLDLLISFIGEPLTWRLVHDAWPHLPAGAFAFDRGSRHET